MLVLSFMTLNTLKLPFLDPAALNRNSTKDEQSKMKNFLTTPSPLIHHFVCVLSEVGREKSPKIYQFCNP